MTGSPREAFVNTVRQRGTQTAIICGDQVLTFSEWRTKALAYAAAYRGRGLEPGGRVLLWIPTSIELACAVFGAWEAGGIPTLMDPRSGPTHFHHALRTVRPDVLVITGRDTVPPRSANDPDISVEIIDPQSVDPSVVDVGAPPPLPSAPASIVFTSGSTGQPKGVTQSHGNLLRGCLTVTGCLGTTADDRILCPVPWSFDYGYGQLLTAAIRGATLIIPTSNSPTAVCEAIERHHPTVFAGIPSVFTYLLRGVSPFRSTDLSSFTTLTNTGGTIPAPILEELLEHFKRARVFLNYGLTETYRTSFLPPVLVRERPTSIGLPIPSVDVTVMREDGTAADPGEEGELVHRGDFVCLGYWNDPEATALVRRPDPLAPRDSPSPAAVIFTGDYGVKDPKGFLYFHGRRDQQLKSMGVRVNPAEVEAIIFRSGLVTEVAVVGRKDVLVGHEICAFVVPRDGVSGVQRELGRLSRSLMSPFMVPRRIIVKDVLPKTTTGKIDYPSLRAEAAQPDRDAPGS